MKLVQFTGAFAVGDADAFVIGVEAFKP